MSNKAFVELAVPSNCKQMFWWAHMSPILTLKYTPLKAVAPLPFCTPPGFCSRSFLPLFLWITACIPPKSTVQSYKYRLPWAHRDTGGECWQGIRTVSVRGVTPGSRMCVIHTVPNASWEVNTPVVGVVLLSGAQGYNIPTLFMFLLMCRQNIQSFEVLSNWSTVLQNGAIQTQLPHHNLLKWRLIFSTAPITYFFENDVH